MKRYNKRNRIRAKLMLLDALKARLAERDAEIRRCQRAAWIEPGDDAEEACGLALQRFERTRKALIRTERGMPYWRYAELRLAQMAAAGVELVPTAAARHAYGEGVRG